MVRRALLLLPAGAVVLVLAACGGGSATLTKAQYDAKVSRLCLASSDQGRELHLANTLGDYRHYATALVRIDKAFMRQLASLKPPAAIAAAAASYTRQLAKAGQDEKNAIAAANAGDDAKFRAAIRQQNHDALAAGRYAKTMGAKGCYIP